MIKRTLTSYLLVLTILLAAACILPQLFSNSASLVSNSITTEQFTIELTSPSQSHHALTNSEFQLKIIDNGNVNTEASQVQLHKPVISLQMLQMDCGIVTTELIASSTSSYNAHAAPLMKGNWLATATFALEGIDEPVVLSYQFEVV